MFQWKALRCFCAPGRIRTCAPASGGRSAIQVRRSIWPLKWPYESREFPSDHVAGRHGVGRMWAQIGLYEGDTPGIT